MNQTTISLAGLGLFFTGLHLLASSMQPLANGRMRIFLAKIVNGYCSRAFAGSLLGLVTQSSTAATFVCIGLLNSGVLPLNSILSLIGWSSVGTSLLVFLATVDVRVTGLYVVGIVGIAHLLKVGRFQVARQIVAFLFALGVLFLGIGMVKEAGNALREASWLIECIKISAEFPILIFLIGLVVTLVTQSSASVTILAVTFNASGILEFKDAVLMMLGSNLGSGLSVVLSSANLNAKQRKLPFYQCFVKVFGVLLILPFCWIADYGTLTENSAWMSSLPLATWIAIIYLLVQIVGVLAASALQEYLMVWLEWLCPATKRDKLFEPEFIYPAAAANADVALLLASREQDRILSGLPEFLDGLREETETIAEPIAFSVRHKAACHLTEQIKEFIQQTVLQNNANIETLEIFALQSRNETLISLLNTLESFVTEIQNIPVGQSSLANTLVESLHLILSILQETLAENTEDAAILLMITQDRGQMMEKIREKLLVNPVGDMSERQVVFICTGIFERLVWLIRQIASSRFPAGI